MYKTYTINSHRISCSSDRRSSNSQRHYQSTNDQVCDLVEKAINNVSYNDSRMYKLNNEYKCSADYYRTGSSADERPMPNCRSYVFQELTPKLQEASKNSHEASMQMKNGHFNTNDVSNVLSSAKSSLQDLNSFATANKQEVNSAFEKALYDTNTAGGLAFFSMFIPVIGLGAFAANTAYNNEFDGKISRALDDINEAEQAIKSAGEMLSNHHEFAW